MSGGEAPTPLDLRAVWAAALAELLRLGLAPREAIFRSTEGFNVPTVLAHGTDRHGRTSPGFEAAWRAGGYRGAPASFERTLFGSTAAEIERVLRGGAGDTALSKCPATPGAHLLAYRRAALRRVHVKQYAFVSRAEAAPRAALLLVLDAATGRCLPLDGSLRGA